MKNAKNLENLNKILIAFEDIHSSENPDDENEAFVNVFDKYITHVSFDEKKFFEELSRLDYSTRRAFIDIAFSFAQHCVDTRSDLAPYVRDTLAGKVYKE